MANHLKGLARQIKAANGKFTGSTSCERYTPSPDDPKTCAACKTQKTCADFGPRRYSPDGLDYYCRECRARRNKAVYDIRKDRVRYNRWKRIKGDTLLAFTSELLDAAQDAATKGCWRGPEAIRVYGRLTAAVRDFQRELVEDPEQIDVAAPECTCPTWPCPRHVGEVADTESGEWERVVGGRS